MYQLHQGAIFRLFAWSATKMGVAGVNVVTAVLSETDAMLTDMLLASVISSGAAMRIVAESASALPAWTSESGPTATENSRRS